MMNSIRAMAEPVALEMPGVGLTVRQPYCGTVGTCQTSKLRRENITIAR
jgi:hypothetical protein